MSGEPSLRRTEAKAYFANERTFLHWMNMAVTIGSISAAMSGVAGHAHRKWGDDFTSGAVVVRVLSLLMLSLSILIAVWAGYNFNHRANMLTLKADGPYDSKLLPAVLATCLVSSLMVVFSGAVVRLHSET
ncbi:vacuolar transporter chaperone [Raphidocelis subcapitata]|uniref:Vacuolar transporter chaperone n=1 Tax=Raphidocelis subcapitata TaxID=307507 RepID=A0A2V0PSQ0_9CHLO|nr:vacuolar transporter chaperone [Raphidocelis subcapitata]|eukprot:GBG00376.1 vacuolar transporter chaperone [Raphidocelis subcapitata]